jgi:hypothetical protein
MSDKKVLTFIGVYTLGIFYATYRSIKYQISPHKIKWA